jgi:hypothetical protein
MNDFRCGKRAAGALHVPDNRTGGDKSEHNELSFTFAINPE